MKKLSPAQRRLVDIIRTEGGALGEDGAEYWPCINNWIKDSGRTQSLAFRNQNRTVAALTRDGIITIDEDGYVHLTEKGDRTR